jgi:hypothetical protein
LAHGNEIGTALTTTMNSGARHHTPMALCQLKSTRLPRAPRVNHTTGRTCCHVRLRGNHK